MASNEQSPMSYKRWIFIAILLFGAGLVFGLAAPPNIAGLISEDIAALEELSRILAPFSVFTAIFIFLKNISALLLSFVLSPILCLVPILALITNGWVLAFVSTMVIEEQSFGFLLAGLLPHGIFELPAFFLGEAAALSFGATAILGLLKKERRSLVLPSLNQNLKYLALAFALLLPAAIIETYITPLLLK